MSDVCNYLMFENENVEGKQRHSRKNFFSMYLACLVIVLTKKNNHLQNLCRCLNNLPH